MKADIRSTARPGRKADRETELAEHVSCEVCRTFFCFWRIISQKNTHFLKQTFTMWIKQAFLPFKNSGAF
jgi:hypothetical protein